MRQSVEDLRPRLAILADRYLDQFEQAARRDGQADLMRHFARPFPLAVICELLGLPEEDHSKLFRFAGRLTNASSIIGVLMALPGIRSLLNYLRQQLPSAASSRDRV